MPTPPPQPRPAGRDAPGLAARPLVPGRRTASKGVAEYQAQSPSFTDKGIWTKRGYNESVCFRNSMQLPEVRVDKVNVVDDPRAVEGPQQPQAAPVRHRPRPPVGPVVVNPTAPPDFMPRVLERIQKRRERKPRASSAAAGSGGLRGAWLALQDRLYDVRDFLTHPGPVTTEEIISTMDSEMLRDARRAARREQTAARSASPSSHTRAQGGGRGARGAGRGEEAVGLLSVTPRAA